MTTPDLSALENDSKTHALQIEQIHIKSANIWDAIKSAGQRIESDRETTEQLTKRIEQLTECMQESEQISSARIKELELKLLQTEAQLSAHLTKKATPEECHKVVTSLYTYISQLNSIMSCISKNTGDSTTALLLKASLPYLQMQLTDLYAKMPNIELQVEITSVRNDIIILSDRLQNDHWVPHVFIKCTNYPIAANKLCVMLVKFAFAQKNEN